jgi:hypothetical protein
LPLLSLKAMVLFAITRWVIYRVTKPISDILTISNWPS